MEFSIKALKPEHRKTGCLVLGVHSNADTLTLSSAARAADQASHGAIKRLLKRGDLAPRAGATLLVHDLALASKPPTPRLRAISGRNSVAFSAKLLPIVRILIGATVSTAETPIDTPKDAADQDHRSAHKRRGILLSRH